MTKDGNTERKNARKNTRTKYANEERNKVKADTAIRDEKNRSAIRRNRRKKE